MGFARTGFADDTQALSRIDGKADIADGANLAVVGVENGWSGSVRQAAWLSILGVEGIAQAVSNEVETEKGQGQQHRRKNEHPRG